MAIKPLKHRSEWTEEEEKYLLESMTYKSIFDIMQHLGRTEAACRGKYRELKTHESSES